LQGTDGHADQLGNLLPALSSLDEIPDLLDSLRSKLHPSSASRECVEVENAVCVIFLFLQTLLPSSYAAGGRLPFVC
jgi:hypothetical protein